MFSKTTALLALVATLSPLTLAHSWVEEYQVISSNGSFVGERGYSRGYVPRTDPTYNGFSMMWMLPDSGMTNPDGTTRTRINSSDLMCHPGQRTANYTAKYPKLKVSPGDYVAMKYLENGHVSLPWNITGKPPGSGTVFIFGTTNPSDDEKIVDVLKWNTEGTGGNKRGFLMTAQNFDDGRCHQINCGSISQQRQMLKPNHVAGQPTSTVESWCESDLKIPENAKAGTLTTYWVWQWPTEPNRDCNNPAGKDEYYTTCADFEVVDSSVNQKIQKTPFSVGDGGNPQSEAVSDFKSRTAYTASPPIISMEGTKTVGKVAAIATPFVSQCSADASVKSAATLTMWPQVFVPNTCEVVSTFGTAAASSAAAVYNKAASAYSASSSAAITSAYAAANLKVPKETPWSQAPATQGQQVTASTMPASSAAPGYASASSSAPAVTSAPASYGNSSSATGSVEIKTITTVVVLTSTVPASQVASSSSAASVPAYSSSSAASSSAPPSYSSAASSSSAIPNPYNIQTVATVGGAAPTNLRRHARHFA